MQFALILILGIAGISKGAPAFPLQFVATPAHYSTVTGYQTTIYKPPIPSFQAPIIQPATLVRPIQPPLQASFVIQHPQPIPQVPFVQISQPVATPPQQPLPQPQLLPQPQPQPLPQPQPQPLPQPQPQPLPQPQPQPLPQPQPQPQPLPQPQPYPQPGNGQSPQEVASDLGDTVEIENPELRSSNSAQFYGAPISAYPVYATV